MKKDGIDTPARTVATVKVVANLIGYNETLEPYKDVEGQTIGFILPDGRVAVPWINWEVQPNPNEDGDDYSEISSLEAERLGLGYLDYTAQRIDL